MSTPTESHPRPVPVWMLLVVLGVIALVLGGQALYALTVLVMGRLPSHDLGLFAVFMTWRLLVMALLFAAIRAAWRRRPGARWLAWPVALGLFLFSVEWLDGQFGGKADAVIRFALVPALLVWWALALTHSAASRQYFGLSRRDGV